MPVSDRLDSNPALLTLALLTSAPCIAAALASISIDTESEIRDVDDMLQEEKTQEDEFQV